MGQSEVLKILKRKGKWMSSKDIRKITKQASSSLSNNLRKLELSGDIEKKLINQKEIPHNYGMWRYKGGKK